MLRVTQAYVSALDRAAGKVRVTQLYATVLDKVPSGQGALRATQCYATVLARSPCWVRVTQLYATVLGLDKPPAPKPVKEAISMGVVADFITTRKTFESPSNLTRYLQGKMPIEPSVPAAFAETDEVQSIAIYDGTVSGGTFALTILLRDGTTFTTAGIAFDADAATIEAAIDTASPASVPAGDISVAGGPLTTTPVTLTFDGASVAGDNHALTTIDGALLTGGGTAGVISVTTEGQTERNGWALLKALGVITDTAPPAQGVVTAPTAGANLLQVPPWVIREIAQEIAFTDLDNDLYQTIVTALVGMADSAPLVETARA